MIHSVTVSATVPRSHYGEQNETDVCYSVQHALEAEFGGEGWGFECWTIDCGPTSHGPGAVVVEGQFESSLESRRLDARLSELRAGGLNDAGEWEIPLDSYHID